LIAAAAILEVDGQQTHPIYTRTLADLGMLYNSMGRYAMSEKFTTEALEIREEQRGRESVDYAASLNNLGVLHNNRGNYNEAEKELTAAIALNKSVAGETSLPYAIALNNRGVLYQVLGRFEDAEQDMLQALKVAVLNMKENSTQYTRLKSNLALLYQQQGRYNDAEIIFKEAISAIAHNPLKTKKTNPDYAHMIENLASLYVIMGKTDEAENLYQEALEIYERKFDATYSGYGLTLARLGVLYRTAGRLDRAEDHFIQAYKIARNAYGKQHPVTVDIQSELAVLYWKKQQYDDAFSFFQKSLDNSLEFIGTYFAPMSESEKAAYWRTLQPRFDKFFAFVAATPKGDDLLTLALNYRLATKAMLLSSTTKIKNHILASGDEALINDYQVWLDQKEQLALYYSFSAEDLKEQEINIDSLTAAANGLEKSLSERSGLFDEAYNTVSPTTADVVKKLGTNTAAVEMIRLGHDADGVRIRYMAIVITSSGLRKVVLENGGDLENKYYKLYRNMIRLKRADTYSYAQFWQPVTAVLGTARQVIFSPDGVYNQINLNTLTLPDKKYVLDVWHITSVTTLRDILDVHPENPGESAVIVANPAYGSNNIAPLPGTGIEASAVNRLLAEAGYNTSLYVAAKANETALKAVKNPKVLHIATHGYFIEDPGESLNQVFSIPLHNINENVLLRSGLLLAGAGADNNNNGLTEMENGILTAYEVLNLSLDQTDLVVLSACETGLGDIMAGEGVYGLQRAFLVSGTNAVIMSLWKVDDEATQMLMTTFYSEWMKGGDRHQAFKAAQHKLKEKYNFPYYWGAFLLVGAR
jgi:CHAT domain-containing protein/Flp pilus assembly protein TadD